MMRTVYSLLMTLLTPLLILRLWLKSWRAPAYGQRIGERLACFTKPEHAIDVWLHAVSLGEVNTVAPLIRALLNASEDIRLAITTMTPTGSAQVKKLFGDKVFHVYVPFESSGMVKRFLGKLKPRIAVMVETEIWPNLFHYCHRMGIPVVIANARLAAKSFEGYRKIHRLIQPILSTVSLVIAQTNADAERFHLLGVGKDKLRVTGSLKFDLTVDEGQRLQGLALKECWPDRSVWIAASTHAGEDEIFLQALKEVRKAVPKALLILVPRHPERFSEVAALAKDAGFTVEKRSEVAFQPSRNIDIYLADSIGELAVFYAASEVAVVAGSFIARGGHNVLEPIALGVPVISGPHCENFEKINHDLLAAKAMIQLDPQDDLCEQLRGLLTAPELRQTINRHAQAVLQQHRGAVDVHLECLLSCLER